MKNQKTNSITFLLTFLFPLAVALSSCSKDDTVKDITIVESSWESDALPIQETAEEAEQAFFETEAMDWQQVFDFPSAEESLLYNEQSASLAPYIAGWLKIPQRKRYTEYMIDFKAEYLPEATYCCLSSWKMDYSSLEKEYVSVRTEYEGVQGYAGFQSLLDGERVSIMSFWDIFCQDDNGTETVIRAKLVYPEATDNDSFGGEGTGAHCIVPYDWQENHWYRMHLVCTKYEEEGNTVVEQWVIDLETQEEILLCAYDTGVKDTCFIGDTAVFLENFISSTAGEVRTMEVREAKYLSADSGRWNDIESIYLMPNGGLPHYSGKYNFGVEKDRAWMITSGVGGDWYGAAESSKGESFHINIR